MEAHEVTSGLVQFRQIHPPNSYTAGLYLTAARASHKYEILALVNKNPTIAVQRKDFQYKL
jgi:hypothetical protein